MSSRVDGKRIGRRLAVGFALVGVLVLAGCGVRSRPARPGDYQYPAVYPTAVDDPVVAPGDAPTMGAAPAQHRSRQERRNDSYSGTGTPPPATETLSQ